MKIKDNMQNRESRWHRHQKSFFQIVERRVPSHNHVHSYYKPDTIVDRLAFEFQRAPTHNDRELYLKNSSYIAENLIPVWILYMNNRLQIRENNVIRLTLDGNYKPYFTCPHLYFSYKHKIVHIDAQTYISNDDDAANDANFFDDTNNDEDDNDENIVDENALSVFRISGYMNEVDFYNYINEHKQLPPNELFNRILETEYNDVKPNIKYIQMGAGSGKTFYICKKCFDKDIKNEDVIILTKVNSAKEEIAQKLFEVKEYLRRNYNSAYCIHCNGELINDWNDENAKFNKAARSFNFDITSDNNFNRKVVIATIDSFVYTYYGEINFKNLIAQDMFRAAAKEMGKGTITPHDIFKGARIKGSYIIVDEAQDVSKEYLNAFITIFRFYRNVELLLVGDILQSLYSNNEKDNIYYNIIKQDYACKNINANSNANVHVINANENVKENEEEFVLDNRYTVERIYDNDRRYICRRLYNDKCMNFVNKYIHYNTEFQNMMEYKGLENIIQPMDQINDSIENTEILYDNGKRNKHKISNEVVSKFYDDCIEYHNEDFVVKEQEQNDEVIDVIQSKIVIDKAQDIKQKMYSCFESDINSSPHDWCILTPTVKNNILLDWVLSIVNEYWHKNQFWNENIKPKLDYWKNEENINDDLYCHLFKSENGEPIVISGHEHQTLIMSIHASKGRTFRNVIALNVNLVNIGRFPACHRQKNLFYYSMLNVAYTRQSHLLFTLDIQSESDLIPDTVKKNYIRSSMKVKDFLTDDLINKLYEYIRLCDWYEEYEKISTSDNRDKDSITDNNYQCLRYHVLLDVLNCQQLFMYGTRSSNDIQTSVMYAQTYKLGRINNVELIEHYKSKKYQQKINDFNKATRDDKNVIFPLRKISSYDKEIDKIYNILIECKQNPNTPNYIRQLYLKIINNKNNLEDILILSFIYSIYRYDNDLTDYVSLLKTMKHVLDKEDKQNDEHIINYMKSVKKSIADRIYSRTDYFKDCRLISKTLTHCFLRKANVTALSYQTMSTPMMAFKTDDTEEDKKEKRKQLSPNSNLIICMPINGSLNILNRCQKACELLVVSRILYHEYDAKRLFYLPTIEKISNYQGFIFDFNNLDNNKLNEIDKIIYERINEIAKENIDKFMISIQYVLKYYREKITSQLPTELTISEIIKKDTIIIYRQMLKKRNKYIPKISLEFINGLRCFLRFIKEYKDGKDSKKLLKIRFQHNYKNIKLYINGYNYFNYFIQNPNKVINKLRKSLDISKSFEETLKDYMMYSLTKEYDLFKDDEYTS